MKTWMETSMTNTETERKEEHVVRLEKWAKEDCRTQAMLPGLTCTPRALGGDWNVLNKATKSDRVCLFVTGRATEYRDQNGCG